MVSFLHHSDGFIAARELLDSRTSDPIRLLVGDGNYGAGLATWDSVPWEKEFEDALQFVGSRDGNLNYCRFVFFLTDAQLPVCFSALERSRLSYRLFTWVKPPCPRQGNRFRTDSEYFVLAWKGNEVDVVNNIDPADPTRYSTVHHQGFIVNKVRDDRGAVANPYQKPILLMQKIINMTVKDGGLIVDITCGTGTTAVRRAIVPRC